MTCTMTDTIYKMNIYFCYERNHDCGCYVAADTNGMEDFTEYRGYVMRKGVDVLAGVYDEDCPELARLGLEYYCLEE